MSRLPPMGWASLAALMTVGSIRDPFDRHDHRGGNRRKPRFPDGLPFRAPNDDGPVIDTTRESKRARRRRLAKGTKP